MIQYHHERTLTILCQEIANEEGLQSLARKIHMACMTANDDNERAEIMKKLVSQVRKIREIKRAREAFHLNAAAELALFISEQPREAERIFLLKPEEAAEKAMDLLIENVNYDSARKKLHNDYSGSTGINQSATGEILKILDKRQQRSSAKLSLYGARAGGMLLETYRSKVIQPTIDVLKEYLDDLDPSVREKLDLS